MGKLDISTNTIYTNPWLEKSILPIGSKVRLTSPGQMNEVAVYKGIQPNTNWHMIELSVGDILTLSKDEFEAVE